MSALPAEFASPTSSFDPATYAEPLLRWFDQTRRDLPWRQNRDPFRIWISEVMLQQTQVATVVPYFHRFLERFPTLRHLAEADPQEVLQLWQGLGYYRRALNLHRAAQQLYSQFGEQLPADPAIWRELPGVGRYILGAVLSQAFDLRLPIIEANSQRVLCRLFHQTGDPKSTSVQRWLWQQAEAMLPSVRVGDFNQALMELGSLVCTPTAPKCGQCPWQTVCAAYCQGDAESLPSRAPCVAPTQVAEVAVVVRRQEQFLLLQRPATGRWANLWEFPHLERLPEESAEATAARLAQVHLGIEVRLGQELLTIRHAVTRFRITMICFEAFWQTGTPKLTQHAALRWLSASELSTYPVSSPQRKLIQYLLNPPT